jgi:hypothetical protein
VRNKRIGVGSRDIAAVFLMLSLDVRFVIYTFHAIRYIEIPLRFPIVWRLFLYFLDRFTIPSVFSSILVTIHI